jgi:hypothetical protein
MEPVMSSRRNVSRAVLASALIACTAAAADAYPRHPPGPDRCWAREHHRWVNVCADRHARSNYSFPTLYAPPAFTDPGYPNRSWSDPGTFDPSYYDRYVLFAF